MSVSKAGNAMLAKAHCLFGRRISENDYNMLLQKHNVSEIAGYLKNETYYAGSLKEVKEELVHREQLEALINRFVWDIYLRLAKYSYDDKHLLKMYIEKNEIKQILLAIRLLNAGEMSKFIVSLPVYLAKHMSVDLFKLAKAESYDDLLNAMEHTGYYSILGRFRPISSDRKIDITACETALLTYHYKKILGYIDKMYSGDTGSSLKAMMYYEIDFHNISLIYRMKRYFKSGSDAISANLIDIRAKVSAQTYEALLKADDYTSVSEIFGSQRIVRLHAESSNGMADQMFFQTQSITRYFSQKIFRFSTKPVVAFIAYMALLDIEANNLTNIIEGTRYGLAPDKIRTMLVI